MLPYTFRRLDYPVLIWMIAVHIWAIPALWYFSAEMVLLLLALNFLTNCLGITLGYHRLLAHRSYKTSRFITRILATFGALTLQNGPIHWSGKHRIHHAHSDQDGDPHDSRKGFWYSHILWLFNDVNDSKEKERIRRMTRDLRQDPYLVWLDQLPVQIAMQISLAIAFLTIGGIDWLLWGIPARLIVGYHFTWLVNSATHFWGYKRWNSEDRSLNNPLVALLTWGEGWHNTHHTFDRSARHGLTWWEIDITWYIIWTMKKVGLAWDVQSLPQNANEKAVDHHKRIPATAA